MSGDFPNLAFATFSQWPQPTVVNPTTRTWFPVYSIILAVIATLTLAARILTQIKKDIIAVGLDGVLMCFSWVRNMMFALWKPL